MKLPYHTMDFKSCFYHVALNACNNGKCCLCQAYISGETKYCPRCAKEKNICVVCGKQPIFIPEEASRAIRNFQEGTIRSKQLFTEEIYASKMNRYDRLVQDVEDGKLNTNESVWKVINDIQM